MSQEHVRVRQGSSTIDRISDLEDSVSDIRERMAKAEEKTQGLATSIEFLRVDVANMRSVISAEVTSLRTGILSTFSRLSFAMILVLLIAFIVVASIVGGSVYFDGVGIRGGTGPAPQSMHNYQSSEVP